jgi:hypothetical protein
MTKGTKITIGIISGLAIAGLATYLVLKFKKPKSDEEWDASEEGVKGEVSPIDADTRQKNNFAAVKKYFGAYASDYNTHVVVKKTLKELAQTIGKKASIFGLGDNGEVSVTYWEDGLFTVKIDGIKSAIKGNYYKGGTIIKITGGKGIFASKIGLREEGSSLIGIITRAITR